MIMLIDPKTSVTIKKVSRSSLGDGAYPCYQLTAINESGDFRLIFCCTAESYLLLSPKIKRYKAVNLLRQYMETAQYPVFET